MAENNLTVPLDELEDENQMILNDLELCQKRIEFLQNYRKVLIEFSANCVCIQNKPLINSIESLETQYKQLFNQFNDNKNEETFETTIEKSEESDNQTIFVEEDNFWETEEEV